MKKDVSKIREWLRSVGADESRLDENGRYGGSLYLGSLTSIPDGFNPTVGGYLDLGSLTSIPDGFNPTVGGSLDLRSLTSIPDGFNPTVGGSLDLRSLTSIPDGFNPTVGGSLYLGSLTSIPDGFNPTVGGSLDLGSLTSIPDGFNPTVGGYLDLGSLTSIPDGFNPTVGGSLDLRSLTSIPDGFNPTVGGYFYLGSLTSIPDGFNPTVGGSLDLRSLTSIPDGFNPTVGGYLYLRSREIYRGDAVDIPTVFHWKWRNSEYIKADGIFQKVISHKGNVYRVQSIGEDKITYLVTDGNGKWSHGDTLHDAKEDLIYKISNRDKSAYESLTLDSVLTHTEAIEAYRVITGACSAGTKAFVTALDPKQLKESYTIREIIELTKGNFGAEAFAEFFSKH